MKILCTIPKRNLNNFVKKRILLIIPANAATVKDFPLKMRRPKPPLQRLLLAEGLAVSALVHSRIGLVGTYHNTLQGAVVCILAMMGALSDSTLDTLVSMAAHIPFLLLLDSAIVCATADKLCIRFDK